MKYAEFLERASTKIGAKFIEYRVETGSWVFEVTFSSCVLFFSTLASCSISQTSHSVRLSYCVNAKVLIAKLLCFAQQIIADFDCSVLVFQCYFWYFHFV